MDEAVTGAVVADRLGITLMHEHALVDFIGAAQLRPSRYDANAAFHAVPHLHHVHCSLTSVSPSLRNRAGAFQ